MDSATVLYLPRSFWTNVEPGGHPLPHEQINSLTVHHTVMLMGDFDADGYLDGDLDDIRRYMIRLSEVRPDLYWEGRPEVPYSFVHFYGENENRGIVVEGRGWDRTGAHTANFNSKTYGCAFAGNAMLQAPTPGLIASFRTIGKMLPDPEHATRTRGHRETKATACPGDLLYAVLEQLQPPYFPEHEKKESELPDTLQFVKREDDNPAVFLIIGGKYKLWVPDMPTLARWAHRHGISQEITKDTALVNGATTVGEEP